LYVVAVPSTVAIWAKLVHVDPRQDSILTSVWFVDPFVQLRPIELPDSAIAFRFAGATGRVGALTTMETLRGKLERPKISVTTRDAVYVPAVE
jgi:hypothetical protein